MKGEFQLIRKFFDEYLKNEENMNLLINREEFKSISFWEKKNKEICGFCVAVQENHNELFNFLFNAKFSDFDSRKFLMHKDLCSQRIFHLAVRKRNEFALDKFLEIASGFDFEQHFKLLTNVNKYGRTALHIAVEKKLDEAFDKIFGATSKYTFEHQLKLLSIPDKEGQTILHYAVNWENDFALNRILAIISRYDLPQRFNFLAIADNYGGTVLHLAVEEKRNEALGKIFEAVLNYTQKQRFNLLTIFNDFYETAFHLAISGKNNFALEEIIKIVSGLDPESRSKFLSIVNKKGETIIDYAIKFENDFALGKIMKMASNLDSDKQWKALHMDNTEKGVELFHFFVKNGNVDVTKQILKMADKVLLERKKYFKRRKIEYYYRTFLWPRGLRLAVENGNYKMVQLLLPKAIELKSKSEKEILELFGLVEGRKNVERINICKIASENEFPRILGFILEKAKEILTPEEVEKIRDNI